MEISSVFQLGRRPQTMPLVARDNAVCPDDADTWQLRIRSHLMLAKQPFIHSSIAEP